jgi:tetratricopeptide (TPR) repeat protein
VREAAQQAIELDPSLGDAYGLLATVAYSWDWKWNEAEEEFRHGFDEGAGADTRARYGWSLATRGRFAEAHTQLRLAAEQDPLSLTAPFDEFYASNFGRDVAGQKLVLQRMVQLRPDFLGGHARAVVMAVEQHDCNTARHEADWIAKTYPTVPVTQTVLAFAAACTGNKAETLRRIKQMSVLNAPHYQLTIAYAMLHDADNAITDWTSRVTRARDRFSILNTILSSTKSAASPGMWRWRSAWG